MLSREKILVFVKAVLVVVGITFLAVMLAGCGKGEKAKVPTSLVPLEELLVNLGDTGQPRYAKMNPVLEVEGKIPEEGQEEIKIKARDKIISIIQKQQFSELQSKGVGKLKEEILTECKKTFGEEVVVKEVFLEGFVMQ